MDLFPRESPFLHSFSAVNVAVMSDQIDVYLAKEALGVTLPQGTRRLADSDVQHLHLSE